MRSRKTLRHRMQKSLEPLIHAFSRIRTGQASTSISVAMVPYYGADTPLNQVANVTVGRRPHLQVSWRSSATCWPFVDKAIQSSGLV